MSGTSFVNTVLEEYFTTLSEQISAAGRLKDAVDDLLERRDEATKCGKGNMDEWDVLDQSYICIKLRNAFSEIDTKLQAFKNNLSSTCKQKDKRENDVKTQNTSEEILAYILSIVSELHQYHRTVAECIAPIVEYSAYRERYPSKYEMKECSSVPVTWKAVSEVNRSLRYGYGLSKEDLAAILSWMHGEDMSESARKTLNLKVDGLILTYRERLSKLDSCEFDVPVAYQLYPLVLQDVIKDSCSLVESIAATGQTLPTLKDDLETLIRREIPRVQVQIGDTVYDAASPGKAFENTKQKMIAVRHLVARSAKSYKIEITREQQDLFSLKVLATACIPIANASARTAVLLAFGKANLIQLKPSNLKHEPAHVFLSGGIVNIEVPSQWCLTEDSILLQSLGRDTGATIATVDAVYKSDLDVKAEIQGRAQSLPVVKIVRCSGISGLKGVDKKDPTSKGLRKRLSKATSKLFNRKSTHGMPQKDAARQDDTVSESGKGTVAGIDNLGANIFATDDTQHQEKNVDGDTPVPPPRPRRKARARRKAETAAKQFRLMEDAKHDPKWFSSCKKLEEPSLPRDEDNTSLSVASFEELKDVIDLLSGSSTSSLSLNQPHEIEKTIPKSDAKKENDLRKELESKGKVSPSDSGIGSTMSVKSHPSVSSISLAQLTSSNCNLITPDRNLTKSERQSQRAVKPEAVEFESPGESFVLCSEQGSLMEDAEVEMLSENTMKKCNEEDIEERDDDETPSNFKSVDFMTIRCANSGESSSDVELDVNSISQEKESSNKPEAGRQEEKEGDSFDADKRSVDIDKNTADQTSYDADGSENSLEDNHVEKLLSNSNVHGSTDSLYFSTWTLDELATKAADSPQLYIPKSDKTADSYFVSGLGNSETSDTNDTSEEFQDCREPDAWVYQQFNPRLSWPSGLGDRLAAIWGEKGMQFPQCSATTSKEIWSSKKGATPEKGNEQQVLFDGSTYTPRDQKVNNTGYPNSWLQQRMVGEEFFQKLPSKSDDHWTGLLSMGGRHTEEKLQPEWGPEIPTMHHPGRDSHNYSNLRQPPISDVGNTSQSHASLPHVWSNSGSTTQWRQKYPHFHGSNFSRPSSVPDTVNRARNVRSPVILPHQGMDLIERQSNEPMERKSQSSALHLPSSSTPSVPAHFLNPSFQNWNRNVNSEPLLTATTRRSVVEYEAMYMQQERQHGKYAARHLSQRFNNQKW